MENTSATGGYLMPGGPAPPTGDSVLDGVLQTVLTGITGLPGDLVRLLWQASPTETPPSGTDWCAFGVLSVTQNASPVITHDGAGDGVDVYRRHMDIEVLVSFYGPNARLYGQILSDGMYVPQNSEAMRTVQMAFISASALTAAPELLNQQWIRRYDLTILLRRQVVSTYQVLNILSAGIQTSTD